jgi:hypothetical protein
MSVAAGLTYVCFSFLFGRWLSVTSLIFWFALMVLLGAVIVRLGANFIGGVIVASFAFLWWYFGMAGPYITLDGLMINLRSPLGIMSSAAMFLGIGAGIMDIIEAVIIE